MELSCDAPTQSEFGFSVMSKVRRSSERPDKRGCWLARGTIWRAAARGRAAAPLGTVGTAPSAPLIFLVEDE